jgi:hypothetical protein
LAEQQNEDSNDDKWIFCSDLDEIKIALPKMMVVTTNWCSMKVPPKHKQKLLQRR